MLIQVPRVSNSILGEWNGHATYRGNLHLKPALVSGDRYVSEFLQKTGGHPCDNSLTETTCHRVQNVAATSCPCSTWSHRRRLWGWSRFKGAANHTSVDKSRYLWIGIVRGRFWCGSDHPDGSWSLDTWSQQIGSAFVIGSSAIGNRCHQLAIFVIKRSAIGNRWHHHTVHSCHGSDCCRLFRFTRFEQMLAFELKVLSSVTTFKCSI